MFKRIRPEDDIMKEVAELSPGDTLQLQRGGTWTIQGNLNFTVDDITIESFGVQTAPRPHLVMDADCFVEVQGDNTILRDVSVGTNSDVGTGIYVQFADNFLVENCIVWKGGFVVNCSAAGAAETGKIRNCSSIDAPGDSYDVFGGTTGAHTGTIEFIDCYAHNAGTSGALGAGDGLSCHWDIGTVRATRCVFDRCYRGGGFSIHSDGDLIYDKCIVIRDQEENGAPIASPAVALVPAPASGGSVTNPTLSIRNSIVIGSAASGASGIIYALNSAGTIGIFIDNCFFVNTGGASDAPTVAVGATGVNTNTESIYNTVFLAPNGGIHIQEAGVVGGATYNGDYNIYHPDGSGRFLNIVTPTNLSGYQTATSDEANSVSTDPLVRDAQGQDILDFVEKSTSVGTMYQAGTNVTARVSDGDIFGNFVPSTNASIGPIQMAASDAAESGIRVVDGGDDGKMRHIDLSITTSTSDILDIPLLFASDPDRIVVERVSLSGAGTATAKLNEGYSDVGRQLAYLANDTSFEGSLSLSPGRPLTVCLYPSVAGVINMRITARIIGNGAPESSRAVRANIGVREYLR